MQKFHILIPPAFHFLLEVESLWLACCVLPGELPFTEGGHETTPPSSGSVPERNTQQRTSCH